MPPALPPLYPITLQHGLMLGAALFSLGILGALTKRNAIAILMAIEVMLNGVIVTLVSFARHSASGDLAGQIFGIFIMAVAAGEATVGLALIIVIYRLKRSIDVEAATELRG